MDDGFEASSSANAGSASAFGFVQDHVVALSIVVVLVLAVGGYVLQRRRMSNRHNSALLPLHASGTSLGRSKLGSTSGVNVEAAYSTVPLQDHRRDDQMGADMDMASDTAGSTMDSAEVGYFYEMLLPNCGNQSIHQLHVFC